MLVAGDVLVERLFRRHTWLLQLDNDQGQTVDEADEIRPAGVERSRDVELTDEQEVVVRGVLPVNDAHPQGALPAALRLPHRDGDTFLQQQIDFTVRGNKTHRRTIDDELIDRCGDRLGGRVGIQADQGGPEMCGQHRVALRLAPERPLEPKHLVESVDGRPAQLREQGYRWLFDELVLRVGVG